MLPVNNRRTGERSDVRHGVASEPHEDLRTSQPRHPSSQVRRLAMQGVISRSKNVAPRTRGWLKSVAAILALAFGLSAGLATQDAVAADQAYPVVRFYNERTGTHFYTISPEERDQVLSLYPWFDYEGVQFYAYKTQVAGTPAGLPLLQYIDRHALLHDRPRGKGLRAAALPGLRLRRPGVLRADRARRRAAKTSTGSSIRARAHTSTRPALPNATTSRRPGRGSRLKALPTRSTRTWCPVAAAVAVVQVSLRPHCSARPIRRQLAPA